MIKIKQPCILKITTLLIEEVIEKMKEKKKENKK